MEGCNCLEQYKYTDPDTGMYVEVRNGTCIKTEPGGLPWCYVDKRTCSGQPLLRNGYFFDTCYPTGVPTAHSNCCRSPLADGPAVGLQ